jgi:hypothetical protein
MPLTARIAMFMHVSVSLRYLIDVPVIDKKHVAEDNVYPLPQSIIELNDNVAICLVNIGMSIAYTYQYFL